MIGATNTAAAFREEGNIPASFDDATQKKYEGLLEKKWTSVVRLQKKVPLPSLDRARNSHELKHCLREPIRETTRSILALLTAV